MSSTVATKSYKQQEVISQQYHLCLAVSQHQILGGKHFLILGPETGKIWWLKKVQDLQKKVPLPMDPPPWRKTQVDFFTILAICYDFKNQSPASRVSEWFRQNGKFGQNMETVYQKQKCSRFQRVSIGTMR